MSYESLQSQIEKNENKYIEWNSNNNLKVKHCERDTSTEINRKYLPADFDKTDADIVFSPLVHSESLRNVCMCDSTRHLSSVQGQLSQCGESFSYDVEILEMNNNFLKKWQKEAYKWLLAAYGWQYGNSVFTQSKYGKCIDCETITEDPVFWSINFSLSNCQFW